MAGVTWSASRQGDVYVGTLHNGLGALVYQMEGNKLMATCDSLEMAMYHAPDTHDIMSSEEKAKDTDFLQLLQVGFSPVVICYKYILSRDTTDIVSSPNPARVFLVGSCPIGISITGGDRCISTSGWF